MKKTVYYAIGDIHGELSKLRALHDNISAFHEKNYVNRPHTRIHLGDYVDRGPDSCGVIDFVQDLSDNETFSTINLRGNHEVLMAGAMGGQSVRSEQHWLVNGGQQTLESYVDKGQQQLMKSHIAWFESCPTLYCDQGRGLVFVHAGIDPQSYPACDTATHMWTRSSEFFESENWTNPALEKVRVVHGHTPTLTDYPDISKDGRRINIDTGACYGGPLSAVALAEGKPPQFIFHDKSY
ncbi:metallophosphoesterase family protein [Fretibacter rubidus]|uniref:metallophosphoesterase family protein n=1 Tax=Fretibacter rubidus TaxID=570162 RepID=UPI00352B6FCE